VSLTVYTFEQLQAGRAAKKKRVRLRRVFNSKQKRTRSMTIIHDGKRYRVTSYGNGTAYSVTRRLDGASMHVQGDDASEFHDSVFEQDLATYESAIETLYGEAFTFPSQRG
jgi:hypothetical protein